MTTLTAREVEVARLVARGMTTQRIASELDISPKTVDAHIQHAARRLGGEGRPRHVLILFVLNSRPNAP